jgi:DNA-binding protein YbaB
MSSFDPGELGAGLSAIADQLGDMSERWRQSLDEARRQEYRASDRDGLAEVTVDGRPRVIGIKLHPDALRAGQDEIDRLLTGLLNEALGEARTRTRAAMLETLPAELRVTAEGER